MARWYEGPLASFMLQATGTDVEHDRMAAAALARQDACGALVHTVTWTVTADSPDSVRGTPAERHRVPPALAVEGVVRELRAHGRAGVPLVVVNAPFRLTLLDRELRRHRGQPLAAYMGNVPLCVIDPRVLDQHLAPPCGGDREVTGLCARYAIRPSGTAGVTTEAVTALDLVRALGHRYTERIGVLSTAELHARQAVWHAGRARGTTSWFATQGSSERYDPAWPLRLSTGWHAA